MPNKQVPVAFMILNPKFTNKEIIYCIVKYHGKTYLLNFVSNTPNNEQNSDIPITYIKKDNNNSSCNPTIQPISDSPTDKTSTQGSICTQGSMPSLVPVEEVPSLTLDTTTPNKSPKRPKRVSFNPQPQVY